MIYRHLLSSQKRPLFLLFALLGALLILLPVGFSTGQDVTNTPNSAVLWTTYEDTDSLLTYIGQWQTFPVAGAVGGSLTGTADPGAMLGIYFEGSSIKVIYSMGPEGKPFQGMLDEIWAQFPNSYAETYTYGHEMVFDGLDNHGHTLTITNGAGAIWIEAIQVQGKLVSPPPTLLPITPTPYATPGTPTEALTPPNPALSAQSMRSATGEDYTLLEIHTAGELVNAILNVSNSDPTHAYVLTLAPGTYVLNTEQTGYTALPVRGQVTILGRGGIGGDGLSLYPGQVIDWSILTKTTGQFDLLHVEAGATLTLYNVLIQDGGGPNRFSGGGIVNDGTLYLYNSRVVSNRSQYYGGGMHNNGTATLINSEFTSNKAVDTIDFQGGGGGAVLNYDGATLNAFCTTFETNLTSPTIQGGSSYVPFTIPGGAIYNQSSTLNVHYSNFINNTSSGQNPNCTYWPQYGFCPLHIRDLASTTTVDASNNYWSSLDDQATWGSVNTSPTLLTQVEYGAYPGVGEPCFVPPPPPPPLPELPTPTPGDTPTPETLTPSTPTQTPIGYVYVPCEVPQATGRSGPATWYDPVYDYPGGTVLPYYTMQLATVTWYMVTEESADPQSWVMEGEVLPTDTDHPDLDCGAKTVTPAYTPTPEYTATSEDTPTPEETSTPEFTLTPGDTPTPGYTLTPSYTPTLSCPDFYATQTAVALSTPEGAAPMGALRQGQNTLSEDCVNPGTPTPTPPPAPPFGQCISRPLQGLNIRRTPETGNNIRENLTDVWLLLDGRYEIDPNWFHFRGYYNAQGFTEYQDGQAWVFSFQGVSDPCAPGDVVPGNGIMGDLLMVGLLGYTPTPTPLATFMPTPTLNPIITPTVTPTLPSTGDIPGIIAELATYGVIAYADGLDETAIKSIAGTSLSWTFGEGQAWTLEELQQALSAVQNTASAFNLLKNNDSSGINQTAKDLFKQIMGNSHMGYQFFLLRVKNTFGFGNHSSCDPTASAGCTDNGNSAIALYGTFYDPVTNPAHYPIVHEFGHRFNNQSNDSLRSSLQGAVVYDCVGDTEANTIVFGKSNNGTEWARGVRGWGTSGLTLSKFQQHPTDDGAPEQKGVTAVEIDETTADMFLNWVYRRITDSIDPSTWTSCHYPYGTGRSEQWQGFHNINLAGELDTDGAGNSRYPGDRRYSWMNQQMKTIFAGHTSW